VKLRIHIQGELEYGREFLRVFLREDFYPPLDGEFFFISPRRIFIIDNNIISNIGIVD